MGIMILTENTSLAVEEAVEAEALAMECTGPGFHRRNTTVSPGRRFVLLETRYGSSGRSRRFSAVNRLLVTFNARQMILNRNSRADVIIAVAIRRKAFVRALAR